MAANLFKCYCSIWSLNLPGFPYCYPHKSDYEACFAQLKACIRKEPGNEEHVKTAC